MTIDYKLLLKKFIDFSHQHGQQIEYYGPDYAVNIVEGNHFTEEEQEEIIRLDDATEEEINNEIAEEDNGSRKTQCRDGQILTMRAEGEGVVELVINADKCRWE